MIWRNIKRNGGFTLTELLVVIGILGILAAMTLIAINPMAQFQKARDAKRKAYISEIKTALEFFKIDVGTYPDSNQFPATCGSTVKFTHPTTTTTVYINSMPCDPSGGTFTYTRTSPSQYSLRACLENQHDIDKDTASTGCAAGRYSFTAFNP